MNDENRLDTQTRHGLRILAASTKAEDQGTAQQLHQAANSGQRTDYLEAEAMFNALPAEDRRAINSDAADRARQVKSRLRGQTAISPPVEARPPDSGSWQLGSGRGAPRAPVTDRAPELQPEDADLTDLSDVIGAAPERSAGRKSAGKSNSRTMSSARTRMSIKNADPTKGLVWE